MKLSIIIPLFNSEIYLPICMDSVLRQDLDPDLYEVIIINDGSTDNSLKVANSYAERYHNISVVTKTNGGVGSARNEGLTLAKGDYIYFIDPDDYLADAVLPILLKTADDNNLDILTFASKSVEYGKLLNLHSIDKNVELSEITSGINYISNYKFQNEVWWYLIKRSFIEETELKFIEDRWMEDAILTAQLFTRAQKMATFPLDAHRHVIISSSAMKSKEPIHYLKVIDDNRNAAMVFESMIADLEVKEVNKACIKRLRTRQQSFVFFMMVRMLKSTISLKNVKVSLDELSGTNAYPLTDFAGIDYQGFKYKLLTMLFNKKPVFYLLFRIFNPILKRL